MKKITIVLLAIALTACTLTVSTPVSTDAPQIEPFATQDGNGLPRFVAPETPGAVLDGFCVDAHCFYAWVLRP